MNLPIAIVGMACVYPEANSPDELWENVLAQRRAFRKVPSERLNLKDYFDADRAAEDHTYAREAAVIKDYVFDRVAFRVSGSTYRQTDPTHWLALDVASRALAGAGFPAGRGLPRESTGVVLGNTLTGEFSRANVLRLRWPYVRRRVDAALAEEGWPTSQRDPFLQRLEARYKEPFPAVGEETLAGGLSNTIAGRICNHFDLKGGGYTVDGACASSLLAVAQACSSIAAGDLQVALAGGVDLSLDPFEIVGFAKVGALAPELMRLFDARPAGFWPGEGCGFVVLMPLDAALAQGRPVFALIRGWGVSSDGTGGITRPELEGQLLAVRRAYHRAGFGIDSVAYFEGHGTGTEVGDATELTALSRARHEANPRAFPAAIGSVKGNIGHTKAAAGVAGLIKATLAVHRQTLPPTTGCETPHPILTSPNPALRILREAEPWPAQLPLRAGVAAMGFGGINTHLVLESAAQPRKQSLTPPEVRLSRSIQDAEVFLLEAPDGPALLACVDQLLARAPNLARSELADLAAALAQRLEFRPVRAAVVAASPHQLCERFSILHRWLLHGPAPRAQRSKGVYLGQAALNPRIGFLFPGQGSPPHLDGGAFRRRFDLVREHYQQADWSVADDDQATQIVQPAVATASLAGLQLLQKLGVEADVAVGHSLGELTALHWAGAMDGATLIRIATARGRAMLQFGRPNGTMGAIGAPADAVAGVLNGDQAVIAGCNSPKQTVISGHALAVASALARARGRGWPSAQLPVSHAFHSTLMIPAVAPLKSHLDQEQLQPLQRTVFSSVSGDSLPSEEDLRALLCRQLTSPVHFIKAIQGARNHFASDPPLHLWIEVGPGCVLSGLLADIESSLNGKQPPLIVPLDVGGPSLAGLLEAAACAFVLGCNLRTETLFQDRFTRPFSPEVEPRFFANPCESATPVTQASGPAPGGIETFSACTTRDAPAPPPSSASSTAAPSVRKESALALIRQLIAERTELPPAAILNDSRMLSDLHLNSITVGQLVGQAARRLSLPAVTGLNEFANATVEQIAQALADLAQTGSLAPAGSRAVAPPGVDSWIRAFEVHWVPRPLSAFSVSPPLNKGNRPLPNGWVSTGSDGWIMVAPPGHPLAAPVKRCLAGLKQTGVVVCLPPACVEPPVDLLLTGAHALQGLRPKENRTFVLIQTRPVASGFARTLHLETPGLATCVLTLPENDPQNPARVRAEVAAADGFTEVRYQSDGTRWEPRLTLLPLPTHTPSPPDDPSLPLNHTDVLLVTGGGKGIAAECALAMGRRYGIRLALLGRSHPRSDPELARNLERLAAAGVACGYYQADVTDRQAVSHAVRQAHEALGPITALLHGAGLNEPKLVSALDAAAFHKTLRPKLDGFRHVFAAMDPNQLKLLVTFGSIISRLGLPGEADYALANEWLRLETEQFQSDHPRCSCLVLEWSVWSGVGMGQRLGRVESLLQEGITPIPPDEGIEWMLRTIAAPNRPTAVVVSGRFGDPPTLSLDRPELPLRRFLEKPLIHIPGVELVTEASLSAGSDPYVEDHVYHQERLFPAVMGLEAMAQAAMTLGHFQTAPLFQRVRLTRPVVVPRDGSLVIRLAALVRAPGQIEVVLRSAETDFQLDHFSAICRFDPSPQALASLVQDTAAQRPNLDSAPLPLQPAQDLYRDLLFHTGRFQRVLHYRILRAKECLVQLQSDSEVRWFGQHFPEERVLGDAGVRDAAIHAIQACIPHAQLLPIGIGQISVRQLPCLSPSPRPQDAPPVLLLHAREQSREGDVFHYDLDLFDGQGVVLEQWKDLRLRKVASLTHSGPWNACLLVPHLERRVEELIPGARVRLGLMQTGAMERSHRGVCAIQRALGHPLAVRHRPDGKPETTGPWTVSSAHTGAWTLGMAADQGERIACDLETVAERSEQDWTDLLGPQRRAQAAHLSLETGEPMAPSATRFWTVFECLRKAGLPIDTPVSPTPSLTDGWVLFQAGAVRIATMAVRLQGGTEPLVVALLVQRHPLKPG